MTYYPDPATFAALAQEYDLVPVYRQLVSDTLTPVSAYCRLKQDSPSFLFESVVGGERIGRFSFVGTSPFLELAAYGREVRVTRGGEMSTRLVEDPLALLEEELARYRAPHLPGLPRFCGGAVGYAAYDSVRYTENLPHPPHDDRGLPDLQFGFYDQMVVFDHIRKTILVVVMAATAGVKADNAYADACRQADTLCTRLQKAADGLAITDIATDLPVATDYSSNFQREDFEGAVRRCQEYIRAGDIFQVVLSQRLRHDTQAAPLDIYRALRVVNPSPFMFLLETEHEALVGSSPEIMVRAEEGEITIRPLAGTRRRGKTEAEDAALEAELLADEKERAEHIMLVDLARNDVGRVARYGSVQLREVMRVERYSHVMHITSNVTGELEPGRTALDALRSGLPAGTVSGAPKVRAMQIIDELEPHRRGPYGGAVGYIDFTGNMDTCIALRTLVIQPKPGAAGWNSVDIQAGAGIVADSVPASEYEETLNKARGLLTAIAVAERDLKK